MKKFIKNRVLPIVCALSILISLCVIPVSAVMTMPDEYRDYGCVDDWNARISNPGSTVLNNISLGFKDIGVTASLDYKGMFWSLVDPMIMRRFGEVGIADLRELCDTYNTVFDRPLGETFFSQAALGTKEVLSDSLGFLFLGSLDVQFDIVEHPVTGFLRIYEVNSGLFVVSSSGTYPYVDPTVGVDSSGGNQWIGEVTAADRVLNSDVALETLDRLNLISVDLKESGVPVQLKTLNGSNGKPQFYGIWYNRQFYADSLGNPYVAPYNENSWQSNEERPPLEDESGVEINLEGMFIQLPDGTINMIDEILYDESTKSYSIDSHDTYNYDIDIRYSWTYYVNYTSITYIGQTEEYNKYYEVYYELPDGRSSADLTREELEQLNVSVDVIPYGRSADDTSLRSLYHFDGDTHESSYWNYCTGLTWNEGASLTYMDAGVFNGALYLDENTHEFYLTLPSNITSADFTLQFRIYQSHTAAPVTDSWIGSGHDSEKFVQFNGSSIIGRGGTAYANMPIGTWNEIALIRSDHVLYYYLNGVEIGHEDFGPALENRIYFHFGTDQQTYKYLDEIRVLNYALAVSGASYEPTSVPHDTNLSLVLPTDAVPIADEYWSITHSGENLFPYDLTNGLSSGISTVTTTSTVTEFAHPVWGYNTTYCDESFYDGYFGFNTSNAALLVSNLSNGAQLETCLTYYRLYNGSALPYSQQYLPVGDYVLSVVLEDGTICSFPFTCVAYGGTMNSSVTFDWGTIGVYYARIGSTSGQNRLYIKPNVNERVYIRDIILTSGSEQDVKAEFIESVTIMDEADIEKATLAVRTDLDITSYQIGGARPSIPKKGQVWALVENERITSLQIYNGSAWEAVDGRIWTGERWVPLSGYNIVTLQDMYDIADGTPGYEYIYTESGFWSWWQKTWNAFTEKLFTLLGNGSSGGGCPHAYHIITLTEANCVTPGTSKYECTLCENEYIEQTEPLGHDWLTTELTETTYFLPSGVTCPDCGASSFTAELDKSSALYTCTCSTCSIVWSEQADVVEGEKLYTCSRCGLETRDISDTPDEESWSFIDLLVVLKDGTWKVVKGVVVTVYDGFSGFVSSIDSAGNFFTPFNPNSDSNIFTVEVAEGASIWD